MSKQTKPNRGRGRVNASGQRKIDRYIARRDWPRWVTKIPAIPCEEGGDL